jgi:hypothetical protein
MVKRYVPTDDMRVPGIMDFGPKEEYVLASEYDAMRAVLKSLYEDVVASLRINNLVGYDNRLLKDARAALGLTAETKVDPFAVPMMYACSVCYGHHPEGTPCPQANRGKR